MLIKQKSLGNRTSHIAVLCSVAFAVASCSTDGRVLRDAGPGQGESVAIVVTTVAPPTEVQDTGVQATFTVSGTWLDDGAIDSRHTCAGANISPSLAISNTPSSAMSLAITVIDLAVPEKPLWVVANINPGQTSIQEGGLPDGVIVGATTNDKKVKAGYNGPCPTDSELHQYLLVVYALDQMLEFTPDPKSLTDAKLLYEAIQSSAFDSAETRFFAQTP